MLPPTDFEMVFRGSFSYRKDHIRAVHISIDVNMRIENHAPPDIAKIYFVDDQDNDIPIPNNIVVREAGTGVALRISPIGHGCFLITWFSNYVILLNGVEVMALKNQKQQSLEGVGDFTYSTICP